MEAVTSNCAHIETRGIKACLYGFVAMLVYKDAYGSGQLTHFGLGVPMAEFDLLPRFCDQKEGPLWVVAPYLQFLNLAEMLNATRPKITAKTSERWAVRLLGSPRTQHTHWDFFRCFGQTSALA